MEIEDKDKGSIVKSEEDNSDSNLPIHGAQNSEREDLADVQESVLEKKEGFREFFHSFVESSASSLDLKLEITSQFLDRINAALSPEDEPANANDSSTTTTSYTPPENWKAVHLEAKELIIGNWHRTADLRVPKDLVVKIYFAQRKLIWEIMHLQLKNKVEIKFNEITALRKFPLEDGSEVLQIEVSKLPKFSRETNLSPRCHTKWAELKDDFTGGEATNSRIYTMICAPRVLFHTVDRLLQYNSRLNELSKRDFPTHFNTNSSFYSAPEMMPLQNTPIINSNGHHTDFSTECHPLSQPCFQSNRSMLQTTAIPSYPAVIDEDPRTPFLGGERHSFPYTAPLGNGNGNNFADGMENFDFLHDMNGFGGNMNSYGSNNQAMIPSSSFLENPFGEDPSHPISDHDFHDYRQMHPSESLAPFGNGGNYVLPQISYPNYDGNFNPSQGLPYTPNAAAIPSQFIGYNMFSATNHQHYAPSYPQVPISNPASGNFNPGISSYPQHHIPSSSMNMSMNLMDPASAYDVSYSSITSHSPLPFPDPGMRDISSAGIDPRITLPHLDPSVIDPSSAGIDPRITLPQLDPGMRDSSSAGVYNCIQLPLIDPGMRDPSSAGVYPNTPLPHPDPGMLNPSTANFKPFDDKKL